MKQSLRRVGALIQQPLKTFSLIDEKSILIKRLRNGTSERQYPTSMANFVFRYEVSMDSACKLVSLYSRRRKALMEP